MNRIASRVPTATAAPAEPQQIYARRKKRCSILIYRDGVYSETYRRSVPLKQAQWMCRYFNWLNRAGPLTMAFHPIPS